MVFKNSIRVFLITVLLVLCCKPSADAVHAAPARTVTAYDLIAAMNQLRVSLGNSALIEDPIVAAVAQATANTMAASQMSWHIGNVEGRVAGAGYGGGATVVATENFAVGSAGFSIDEIMVVWSDESHMIPAVNPAYCNVGAGVATAPNGMIYYVLQAAYTSGQSCGSYISAASTGVTGVSISQLVIPVEIAKPDADGRLFHEVKAGQSFWSIAIAYKITIKDLETWNNLSSRDGLRTGQKLFIPGENTQGYATPTPAGMFALSTPDAGGRVVHTVAAYQTLSTISQAYRVTIPQITSLNGIQADSILSIGQNLLISTGGGGTPGPADRPLTAVEKLTPADDGMYYHEVRNGENPSGIAAYYDINLNQLMGWNGLNVDSLIRPGQKLLLQVTPPATLTPTPVPATETPLPSNTPPATRTATLPALSETPATDSAENAGNPTLGYILIGVSAVGLLAAWQFWRRRTVA